MQPILTKALSDGFFTKLVIACEELQCAPADLLLVIESESNLVPSAWNKNGNASGLLQIMPFNMPPLGWTKGHEEFRKLSGEAQVPFIRRYLLPYKGKLVNATAVYVSVFLPALVEHAADPTYQLVIKNGRLGWAYAPNLGFDADKDGDIEVQELTRRLDKCKNARWGEAIQRAGEAMLALDSVG
jgi:hypothetical protein